MQTKNSKHWVLRKNIPKQLQEPVFNRIQNRVRRFFPYLFYCALTGCGYHWYSHDALTTQRPTIAIPYVNGDSDGSLTQEMIRAFSSSGICTIQQHNALYSLQASLLSADTQSVGYRRDQQKIGKENKKNLVASEARKTLSLELSLREESSQKIVCGPLQIEADVVYDYMDGDSMQDLSFISSSGIPLLVLPFALGQLEPIDAAAEAAMRPLNAQIAQKILAIITNYFAHAT